MKTIKYVIATTLPDIGLSKFTHHVLPDFRNQINQAIEKLPVKDTKGNIVGHVINSKINSAGQLAATMEIDTNLIDTGWEYFFVPDGRTVEESQQGKFNVITKAVIDGVKITKMPADMSLIPFVFEPEFKEGTDYLIIDHSELKAEDVQNLLDAQMPIYVYFPATMAEREIVKEVIEKGIFQNNEVVFPFEIRAWAGTIDNLRETVKSVWKTFAMERMGNPLKHQKRK